MKANKLTDNFYTIIKKSSKTSFHFDKLYQLSTLSDITNSLKNSRYYKNNATFED